MDGERGRVEGWWVGGRVRKGKGEGMKGEGEGEGGRIRGRGEL